MKDQQMKAGSKQPGIAQKDLSHAEESQFDGQSDDRARQQMSRDRQGQQEQVAVGGNSQSGQMGRQDDKNDQKVHSNPSAQERQRDNAERVSQEREQAGDAQRVGSRTEPEGDDKMSSGGRQRPQSSPDQNPQQQHTKQRKD